MIRILIALLVIIPCYWYGGNGDGYLGKRHAASWHEKTCEGFPEVVDEVHYGIALNGIPFCEKVTLEIIDIPEWAEEEYSHLIGRTVEAVVIDRTPWQFVDMWPATARALLGEDYQRVGTATVKIWRMNEYQNHRRLRERLRLVSGEAKTTQRLPRKHN